uniref:LysM domain-containing protein n=1 Tax=Debaryomyces robertsiae TaxID=28555 RepID=Q707V6_9ASCO|nr:hypothetical protein [Debaryomyces robertsiae]
MILLSLIFLATLVSSQNIMFGYTGGDKIDIHKKQALASISEFKSLLNNFDQRQSFKYQKDDIAAFVWSGSMVDNKDFSSNLISVLTDEVNEYGIPDEVYMEYVGDDSRFSFGAIINTKNNLDRVQTAVKKWSMGVSYNSYDGKKTYSKDVTFLSKNKKKKEQNDKEAGECFYFRYDNSLDIGIDKAYIKVFNSDLDINKLEVGEAVCKSEGTRPKLKLCKPINKELYFKYFNKSPKLDSNKNKALKALKSFKGMINNTVDRQSFEYNVDNIAGYMWIGQLVNDTHNTLNAYISEVTNNGAPDHSFYEYITKDPMTSFGIFLNVHNNVSMSQEVVKRWSMANSYNNITGKKNIDSGFCLLNYKDRKSFLEDNDAGQCFTFKFTSFSKVPVNNNSLNNYNDDFYDVDSGQTLCKSIGYLPGNMPISKYCKFYTVKDGDTCKSVAAKFPHLTEKEIISYNSKNGDFYGCDMLWEGDKICISKPYM